VFQVFLLLNLLKTLNIELLKNISKKSCSLILIKCFQKWIAVIQKEMGCLRFSVDA